MSSGTVILAAGDFPRRGGIAWRLLAEAKQVVACDSAANLFRRRFRRWPDVVVGDLDSAKLPKSVPSGTDVVRVAEQETNDLEKAIALCRRRKWKSPVIVGATGKREDHAIGNVFRALAHGLEIVSDHGRFLPVCGRCSLSLKKGAAVSVFAPDPATRMTSSGLEWSLDGVKFSNLYCATLNRAVAGKVTLTATHPVCVYVAHGSKSSPSGL